MKFIQENFTKRELYSLIGLFSFLLFVFAYDLYLNINYQEPETTFYTGDVYIEPPISYPNYTPAPSEDVLGQCTSYRINSADEIIKGVCYYG